MKAGLCVVSLGGGNGLSALLASLRQVGRYLPDGRDIDITAVVTVSDDGGSSGRLRREFGLLPPGDIRNCMVALSEDGALLSRLFQYRFDAGRGLKGHSFGNLFLTALTAITGDFAEAVRKSSEVLNMEGQIYPATPADVSLEAELENGRIVRGETKISRSRSPIRKIRVTPAGARPLSQTLQAIEQADLITLGPGSLFTSVIPNLLVRGIPRALRQSKALKVYFLNLMTQPGETTGFRASDHIEALTRHAGGPFLDVAVASNSVIPPRLLRLYKSARSEPIEIDREAIQNMGIELVEADLFQFRKSPKVRHDARATAQVVIDLARRGRARRTMQS
jgi:uncharacterized cofD-like protein